MSNMQAPYQYRHIDPLVLFDVVQDMDAFRHISGIYLETAPPMHERLQKAVLANDRVAIAHAAHSLRGSTSLIGANQLSQLLRDMERLARAEESGPDPVPAQEMTELFDKVMEEVKISIIHFQGILKSNCKTLSQK
ncbi:Hpt domain-containing protein [Herbaspirillum sp. RTI4]|uniref:Hpt domain-containing protein n=1 Tax=Herbaspirillum sp. RTI4 TaxID=3048640 RepID=UPI002AB5949B|nr:Hpt domain-containing protein [Herbaspirillum sp. RTI4]MDY7578225.1 Hpt domain-containing protein [Herbaspirillum sp. RTI4]MEA9981563.1 Hpt domain-containing protein [Herbaspirillum sp. RTI4]